MPSLISEHKSVVFLKHSYRTMLVKAQKYTTQYESN